MNNINGKLHQKARRYPSLTNVIYRCNIIIMSESGFDDRSLKQTTLYQVSAFYIFQSTKHRSFRIQADDQLT